jgi:hypothetical protein
MARVPRITRQSNGTFDEAGVLIASTLQQCIDTRFGRVGRDDEFTGFSDRLIWLG